MAHSILMHCSRLTRLWFAALVFAACPAGAMERVSYESLVDGRKVVTEAIFHGPATPSGAKVPAVVIVHSAGGWSDGTTAPLAKALLDSGLAALELKIFERHNQIIPPDRIMPVFYGAMKYLAGRAEVDPQRIGIAGFSMGAHISLWTASSWMTSQYGQGLKFAAHAPIYPVCWPHTYMAKGTMPPTGRALPFPQSFLTEFTGAPVRIFAAGQDDYDDRDPNACVEFVNALSPSQKDNFEVTVYKEATHGWNQTTQSFYERMACKGRGCLNRNVNNPEITARSLTEVTAFFVSKLRP